MRKITKIATTSFLTLLLASCTGTNGGAPRTILKSEPSANDVSLDRSNDAGNSVITYHIGPYDLPSDTSSGLMAERPGNMKFNVDEPLWITSFEPKIEDSDGNALPSELVQSIILINHGEENTFCTTKQTGNPFAAATSNMEKIELPEGYGYPLLPSDQLEAKVVLKNQTGQDYRGVFVKFSLAGRRDDGKSKISDVKPLMVDLDPCDHGTISIAPGQYIEKTNTVVVPEAGSLIKAYGLLQNFGVSVTMSTSSQKDPFWQGMAQINDKYQIIDLPHFEDLAGISVKRGDDLSLTVAYDNCSDKWFDEASGAAIVYLARADETIASNNPPPTEQSTPSATEVQSKILLK